MKLSSVPESVMIENQQTNTEIRQLSHQKLSSQYKKFNNNQFTNPQQPQIWTKCP